MARLPWPDRLLSRIEKLENGCWHLGPYQERHRYGQPFLARHLVIKNPDTGRAEPAYITIYRLLVGQPPHESDPSLILRQTCDDSLCVNPAHREPMSRSLAQALVIERHRGYNPLLVCARGHSRELHGYTTVRGKLHCKRCERDARRAYRLTHPEQELAANRRSQARRRHGLTNAEIALLEHQPPVDPDLQACPETPTTPPGTR